MPPRQIDWAEIDHAIQQKRAAERIRETQQGLGRPIISAKVGEHTMVAIGSSVHWGKTWKTFPDMLNHYIKAKLGGPWAEAELAKPLAERHPLFQWYDTYTAFMQSTLKVPGEVSSAAVTGIVACVLGLAYGLYMLDHNVELQERLIRRLKDPSNFQGAYYEIIVARVLLRAGFALALEDEADGASKHCEFSAISKSGKKYWVEARMRSIAGRLGKTTADGAQDDKPTKKVIPHLNGALAKPAADDRLIFIDLNTHHGIEGDTENPRWLTPLLARLEEYERDEMVAGTRAYLFVTNVAYHLQLDRRPTAAVLPYGLGLADFMKPGVIPLVEAYRRKRAHADAFDILKSFMNDTKFPQTLDGLLPSEAFHGSQRVLIGNTYHFEHDDGADTVGTVTSATVDEAKKEVIIGVSHDGIHSVMRHRMTDAELSDYREHRDAYFGRVTNSGGELRDPLELLEWLVQAQAGRSRESILAELRQRADYARFEAMNDHDLRVAHADLLVAAIMAQRPQPQAPKAA